MTLKVLRDLLMAMTVAAIAVLCSASVASATSPEVTTEAPTNVSATKATFHGTIATGGDETGYSFAYGLDEEYGNYTEVKVIPKGEKTVSVSFTVEGLQPDSTYHVALTAQDYVTEEFGAGKDLTFQTTGLHHPLFEAGSYPATLSGAQDAKGFVLFKSSTGTTLSCSSVNFTGSLSAAATTAQLSPEASGCTFGERAATVKANSCSYGMSLANSGPPYTGPLSISCAKEGDKIEISVTGCVVKFGAQSPGGSVSYENQGGGSTRTINASVSASGVKFEKQGLLCGFVGGNGSDASIGGGLSAKALNEAKAQVALYIGGEKTLGLYLSGEQSTEEAKQPRFNAHEYPASISGASSGGSFVVFENASSTATCTTASFGGSLTGATASLQLSPSFSGCKFNERATTVKANSCTYTLSLANSGPPYTGPLSISCAKEGDKIEISVTGCVVKLGAQSPGGSTSYENVGKGNGSTIKASVAASGVKYEKQGLLCGFVGNNKEDGVISGGISLGQGS